MSSTELINTKKVEGRRELRFESFDELLADVEQLAAAEHRTLGNWSFGQILRHLARSLDSMIDGAPFSFPKPVQWVMRLLMKKRFTTKTLSPGFQLPKKNNGGLLPEETTLEDGLSEFRTAINRAKSETTRAPHGGFGQLTKDETDQFHLRHAEMHMSFVVPQDAS